MADAVYTPETIVDDWSQIGEQTTIDSTTVAGQTNSVSADLKLSPSTTKDVTFPERVVARQLINEALDTQLRTIKGEFQFTESGAIQVGKYIDGVSGDISITPTGITGRDINGANTFSIDATTGDATFKGTIQAGSIIAGNVGSSAQVILDGTNNRIIVNDGTNDRVLIGYQSGGF